MDKRVAIILANYNMPERADAIAEHIKKHMKPWMYDLILVGNGSDQVPPAKNTTILLRRNRQTCGGWLAGLDYADFLVKHKLQFPYFAYWIMITSMEFVDGFEDILSPMVQFLEQHKNAVVIHPALTEDSTTAWNHLIARNTYPQFSSPRRTWMVDNIAALYRAEWFDSIRRFDPFLTYAWGTDLETCYLARKQGRGIYVDERVRVKKVTNIGYTMDRMGETAASRTDIAYAEMSRILEKRYGAEWNAILRRRYVLDEWK
jgi:hypothetical protein